AEAEMKDAEDALAAIEHPVTDREKDIQAIRTACRQAHPDKALAGRDASQRDLCIGICDVAPPTGWWAMPTRSGGAAWPSRRCTPGARRCGSKSKHGRRTIRSPKLWRAQGCCEPTRIECCCALSKAARSAASPRTFWPGVPTGSPRGASADGCWCGTSPPGTSVERCRRGLGRITAR